MRIATAMAVALMVAATPALSGNVRVGDRDIAIVLPTGFCELQADEKSDARVLKAIRGMIEPIGNTLLSAASDCGVLKAWRASKLSRMKEMTQVQTLAKSANDDLSANANEAIKQSCDEIRKDGKELAAQTILDTKKRAAEVMKGIKYNEMQMIGVVDETPGVCYVALLQKFLAEDKTDVTQLTTYASMIVKGKVMYFYLFSDYLKPDSVTSALARHKENVRAFIAANEH